MYVHVSVSHAIQCERNKVKNGLGQVGHCFKKTDYVDINNIFKPFCYNTVKVKLWSVNICKVFLFDQNSVTATSVPAKVKSVMM